MLSLSLFYASRGSRGIRGVGVVVYVSQVAVYFAEDILVVVSLHIVITFFSWEE